MSSEYENLSCRTIPECINLIENFIEGLGMNISTCQIDADIAGLWSLTLGEIPVYISVIEAENNFIKIDSFLIKLPQENREPLLLRCLQLNRAMLECHFSINEEDDTLRIGYSRFALGLDSIELSRAFTTVLTYSNMYRDELVNDFGGTPLSAD